MSHLGVDALAFVEGALARDEQASAEAHIAACPACAEEVRRLRAARSLLLQSWPATPELPEVVHKRLHARLEGDALRPQRAPRFGRLLQAAAVVLLALSTGAGGFLLGRQSAASGAATVSADDRPTFALLLEEASWPPAQPLVRSGYREWSNAMAAANSSLGGRKLTDDSGWRVNQDGTVRRPEHAPCATNLSGWFLVRAGNYEEAIDWARRGPHLRYGGVLVRQVE
jgi:hypothetical protein